MVKGRRSVLALTLCCAVLFCYASQGDLVVVVNVDNPVNQLSKSQVIDLFMGKYVAFPGGAKASPVDIEGKKDLKRKFYQSLVGMSLARVNSFWSRIKFTGRASPPLKQPSEEAIIDYVAVEKYAIGYISRENLNNKLKVVFEFNE